MGNMTFIVGGARSGKSRHAAFLAGKCGRKIAFIATCNPSDAEMKKRVRLHQAARPGHWHTFEEPSEIVPLLKKIGNDYDGILIDCLTLLVSNWMLKKMKPAEIEWEAGKLASCLRRIRAKTIIVSNEVGLGIVPGNKLARDFRDIAGKVNQKVAGEADRVIFMVSGLPMQIKKRKGK